MNTAPTSAPLSPVSRRAALRLLGLAGAGAWLGSSPARAADAPARAVPSLGGRQPGYYRFSIGSIEALVVNDGGFAVPAEKSPIGVGQPADKIVDSLRAAYLPGDSVRLPFNVLVVRLGAELVMIDSGCGPAFGAAGGHLVTSLAAAGVKPEQISAIVVSHLHGDHFGGLLDANGEAVFKQAKLFLHRTEHAHFSAQGDEQVQKYLKAFQGRWQLVTGGEKLFPGLEIVETFGHTPGHVAVAITSGRDQLFHLVDVVHHHALSFQHPDWVMQYDVQSDAAIATRKRILDRCAADRSRIFGAHLPFPALGRVRRSGVAFEFVSEPWASA